VDRETHVIGQITEQLEAWTSDFGEAYTRRNAIPADEADVLLGRQYGIESKSALFREVLGPRLREGRALEVGCNVGNQLHILRKALPELVVYGVEPQAHALRLARERNPEANPVLGTAFDIPFKDGWFDLVMTNRVLIHIGPQDLDDALREIHRCSRRYIWCCEYYAEATREVAYHGQAGLLWKTDFMQRYLDLFPDLRPVEVRYYDLLDAPAGERLVDQVCLLEKTAG
jgi:pseudaminic acid biosynthesis-associated methylase